MGELEPSLPCRHFSIAILVFLLFPLFWLLLSALLTILMTNLRVLVFLVLFPANFSFPLPHVRFYFCLDFLWRLHTSPYYWGFNPQMCTTNLLIPLHYHCFSRMIFELRSLFLAEVLISREALLSLPFSYFTASFSMSFSFPPATQPPQSCPYVSCLPTSLETLLLEFPIRIPAKITRTIETPAKVMKYALAVPGLIAIAPWSLPCQS